MCIQGRSVKDGTTSLAYYLNGILHEWVSF